jgi:predicted ferric reductase
MNEMKKFCEMSILIKFMSVNCLFILSVVCLFCMKLSIQTMIQSKMRFLRKSWINFSFDTWSYASITFKFSKIVILFLLIFHTMWICFVKSSTSFRMFFFNVHSFVFEKAACVFSLNCWFVWQWLISMSCLICEKRDESVRFEIRVFAFI